MTVDLIFNRMILQVVRGINHNKMGTLSVGVADATFWQNVAYQMSATPTDNFPFYYVSLR